MKFGGTSIMYIITSNNTVITNSYRVLLFRVKLLGLGQQLVAQRGRLHILAWQAYFCSPNAETLKCSQVFRKSIAQCCRTPSLATLVRHNVFHLLQTTLFQIFRLTHRQTLRGEKLEESTVRHSVNRKIQNVVWSPTAKA